jgi:glucose/arabinose dehydrogenase
MTIIGLFLRCLPLAVVAAVFSDYRGQQPGTVHKITPADLPPPYATKSVDEGPSLINRPPDAWPKAPEGFTVQLYWSELENPRLIRTAPNGDLFVAESRPGRIKVLRGIAGGGKAQSAAIYATGLRQPFGIAFYPPGPNPQYLYVANTNSVVRFPYANGDLKATGSPQVIVPDLPSGGRLRGGGHWTRDIAFSRDGRKMYIAVGSHSNVDDTDNNAVEFHRANIQESSPDGTGLRMYASGIRNPVGIAVDPQTGLLWASVNERDELGDNTPPDYITHVEEGGFYGWPWYYIGGNQDPRHKGKHPELKDKVIVPDVLVQPHNAGDGLLRGRAVPQRVSGTHFRRGARFLESSRTHRIRSDLRAAEKRSRHR